MHPRYLAATVAAAVIALGVGSAFADTETIHPQPPKADREVVQQLRSLNREMRALNHSIGYTGKRHSLVDALGKVVRNTEVICEQYSAFQCESRF